jgi:hypothetical protein
MPRRMQMHLITLMAKRIAAKHVANCCGGKGGKNCCGACFPKKEEAPKAPFKDLPLLPNKKS